MNTKRFDAVALEELLIDFTENGFSGQRNTLFEANPGADMMLTVKMLKRRVFFRRAA